MGIKPLVVFFAIPCGDFYDMQVDIIRSVSDAAGIVPDIIEDDPGTKGLWDKITQRIDAADYFIADITSKSPNIVVELGYAIARKPIQRIAVLIADYVPIPSDLGGLIVQKYSSLRTFQQKLIDWMIASIPFINKENFGALKSERVEFAEDFQNQDLFLRRWTTPPRCSYLLTPEGLKFSWAHFPILIHTLAILKNCEFEFDARIEEGNIGWAVKGTTPPNSPIPTFLVMFNLGTQGRLVPHVWTAALPVENTHYHVYESEGVQVDLDKSKDGWFTILTHVKGDVIDVFNKKKLLFRADFSVNPYAEAYSSISQKMGQVGFRCYPGEIATVRRVRIREI